LGCVYLPLTGELKKKVLALAASVPDDLLDEKGRETEPHITALYGLTNDDPAPVKELLSKVDRPVPFMLGGVSVFANDKYDVLKVEVYSPYLHAINQLLSTLPNENEYTDYIPHVTLAYVKCGEGQALADMLEPLYEEGEATQAVFSDSTKTKTQIKLGEPMTPTQYTIDNELVKYKGYSLEQVFNPQFQKLADRLHSEGGVADVEAFKNINHAGYVLKATNGDEEKASDIMTNMLYGRKGTGALERAHKPNDTLGNKFRFHSRVHRLRRTQRNTHTHCRNASSLLLAGVCVVRGELAEESELVA
jgi:2'-5' RNA ligase